MNNNSVDLQNLIRPIADQNLSVDQLLTRAANVYLMIAGILAFFYLVYSGILYITSSSNPDQAKKAQAGLINVIIGVIIISLSNVIIRTVGSFVITIFK